MQRAGRMDGHRRAAVAACSRTRRWTASVLRRRPVRVGNSGWSGWPARSVSQTRSTAWVVVVNGTARCLRPLPRQRTLAPAPRVTSPQLRPGQLGEAQSGLRGHEQQRPVAAAFPSGQVGCGQEGVDLGAVRNETSCLSKRLAGMARTCWMSAFLKHLETERHNTAPHPQPPADRDPLVVHLRRPATPRTCRRQGSAGLARHHGRPKRYAHSRLRHTDGCPIPLDSATATRGTIGRGQRSRNQDWCSTRRSTRGLTAQYAWGAMPFTAARQASAAGTVTGVPSVA